MVTILTNIGVNISKIFVKKSLKNKWKQNIKFHIHKTHKFLILRATFYITCLIFSTIIVFYYLFSVEYFVNESYLKLGQIIN